MSDNFLAMSAVAGQAPGGATAFVVQMLPFLLIILIFWVLMIRPQQKRMREHAATIAAVKKGDQVITAGGIRGRITRVDDQEVEVEIASGVKVKVVKSTLSDVVASGAKPAND